MAQDDDVDRQVILSAAQEADELDHAEEGQVEERESHSGILAARTALPKVLVSAAGDLLGTHTVGRLRDLCDRRCPAGYDLDIVDIYQQPALVVSCGVVAVPTLIKDLPHPVRRLVGDFTDEARVLAALDLPAAQDD